MNFSSQKSSEMFSCTNEKQQDIILTRVGSYIVWYVRNFKRYFFVHCWRNSRTPKLALRCNRNTCQPLLRNARRGGRWWQHTFDLYDCTCRGAQRVAIFRCTGLYFDNKACDSKQQAVGETKQPFDTSLSRYAALAMTVRDQLWVKNRGSVVGVVAAAIDADAASLFVSLPLLVFRGLPFFYYAKKEDIHDAWEQRYR